MDEERLDGGLMNAGVVRVGATVRRAASPWSTTIHRLLTHVRAAGVAWVPGFHGMDAEGREVLDYIDGEVAHGDPHWIRSDDILVDVARALREWHDATATFPREPGDQWFLPGHPPFEVIAHNDFAPYNHVFRNRRFVGAIDFDLCYPASRAWDLAWTAYRYVPLTPPADCPADDGPGADRNPFSLGEANVRLEAFVAAYTAPGPSTISAPSDVLVAVPPRLDAIADWCAEQSNPDLRRNGVMYRAHARWIESDPFGATGRDALPLG